MMTPIYRSTRRVKSEKCNRWAWWTWKPALYHPWMPIIYQIRGPVVINLFFTISIFYFIFTFSYALCTILTYTDCILIFSRKPIQSTAHFCSNPQQHPEPNISSTWTIRRIYPRRSGSTRWLVRWWTAATTPVQCTATATKRTKSIYWSICSSSPAAAASTRTTEPYSYCESKGIGSIGTGIWLYYPTWQGKERKEKPYTYKNINIKSISSF